MRSKSISKRSIALLLSLILIFGLFPAIVSAGSEPVIIKGFEMIDSGADKVTALPSLVNGQVWTDKSVIDHKDGTFGVTLSMAGRQFLDSDSFEEDNNPALNVVFVLDMSTSMLRQDVETMIAGTIAAANAIWDKNADSQIGIVAFAQTAALITNLTNTRANISAATLTATALPANATSQITTSTRLNGRNGNFNGYAATNIMAGLNCAVNALGNLPNRSIILMSDGAPNTYYDSAHATRKANFGSSNLLSGDPSGNSSSMNGNVTAAYHTIIRAGEISRQLGVKIFTMGYNVANNALAVATLNPTIGNINASTATNGRSGNNSRTLKQLFETSSPIAPVIMVTEANGFPQNGNKGYYNAFYNDPQNPEELLKAFKEVVLELIKAPGDPTGFITITDNIGAGFEIIGELPAGLSFEDGVITWIDTPEWVAPYDAEAESSAESYQLTANDVLTITFTVKASPTEEGKIYTNNGAKAVFNPTAHKDNIFYDANIVTQKLDNRGWAQFERAPIEIPAQADISVTKTANPKSIVIDITDLDEEAAAKALLKEVEYIIVVKNNGDVTLTDVVVTDKFDDDFEADYKIIEIKLNGAIVDWEFINGTLTIETLEPDDQVIITYTVILAANGDETKEYVNNVEVTGKYGDTDVEANDSATVKFDVIDVKLNKVIVDEKGETENEEVAGADTVNYKISLTNNSTVELKFTLADIMEEIGGEEKFEMGVSDKFKNIVVTLNGDVLDDIGSLAAFLEDFTLQPGDELVITYSFEFEKNSATIRETEDVIEARAAFAAARDDLIEYIIGKWLEAELNADFDEADRIEAFLGEGVADLKADSFQDELYADLFEAYESSRAVLLAVLTEAKDGSDAVKVYKNTVTVKYEEEEKKDDVTVEIEPDVTLLSNLRLTKQVTGTGADTNKEFEFTVTFSNPVIYKGEPFTSGTVILKHGGTESFSDIAMGTAYTIVEANYSADRYTSNHPDNTVNGTVSTAAVTVAFINTYTPPPPPWSGDGGRRPPPRPGGDDDEDEDTIIEDDEGDDDPRPPVPVIVEQIDLEDFEDVSIPLADGYIAIPIQTEEGEDDIYEIFDDEGTPLGIVIIPEGEDIEELFDADDIIPLADFITLIEETVEEEIVIIELAEEVIIEDIPEAPAIPTAPQTGTAAPKTNDRIIVSILFLTLAAMLATSVIFKRKRIV